MQTVFVSSTFTDFQDERDVLHDVAQAQLDRKAAEYGEAVQLCDLRWGIDTADQTGAEADRAVLEVCLNEIDRSRPRMIVLFGGRYGYCPGEDRIRDELSARRFTLDDCDISVTHLEVLYGTLMGTSAEHVYFYIRDDGEQVLKSPESADQAVEKLRGLISRFADPARFHVRFYRPGDKGDGMRGLREFAQMVCGDLEGDLTPEWERLRDMASWQREQARHEAYLSQLAGSYVPPELLEETVRRLASRDREDFFIFLKGDRTDCASLIAHSCLTLQKEGWAVVPVFCGMTARAGDGKALCVDMIHRMEAALGLPDTAPKGISGREDPLEAEEPLALSEKLNQLCAQAEAAGKRVLFAVEGLDRIQDSYARNRLCFLPFTPFSNVRVLGSFSGPVFVNAELTPVPPLPGELVGEAVLHALRKQGKRLAPAVLDAMREKKSASLAGYRQMMLLCLSQMGREDFEEIARQGGGGSAIADYQANLVRGMRDDPGELLSQLLYWVGERIGLHKAMRTGQYLTFTRAGLGYDDLAELLAQEGQKFSPLEMAQFQNGLEGLLYLDGEGRLRFFYPELNEAFQAELSEERKKEARELMIAMLWKRPQDDRTRCAELYPLLAEQKDWVKLTIALLGLFEANKKGFRPAYRTALRSVAPVMSEYLAGLSRIVPSKTELFNDCVYGAMHGLTGNLYELGDDRQEAQWQQAVSGILEKLPAVQDNPGALHTQALAKLEQLSAGFSGKTKASALMQLKREAFDLMQRIPQENRNDAWRNTWANACLYGSQADSLCLEKALMDEAVRLAETGAHIRREQMNEDGLSEQARQMNLTDALLTLAQALLNQEDEISLLRADETLAQAESLLTALESAQGDRKMALGYRFHACRWQQFMARKDPRAAHVHAAAMEKLAMELAAKYRMKPYWMQLADAYMQLGESSRREGGAEALARSAGELNNALYYINQFLDSDKRQLNGAYSADHCAQAAQAYYWQALTQLDRADDAQTPPEKKQLYENNAVQCAAAAEKWFWNSVKDVVYDGDSLLLSRIHQLNAAIGLRENALEKARKHLEKGIDMLEKFRPGKGGVQFPLLLSQLCWQLGDTLFRLGEPLAAVWAAYEKALDALEKEALEGAFREAARQYAELTALACRSAEERYRLPSLKRHQANLQKLEAASDA